jgi:uncharacterized membrane protein
VERSSLPAAQSQHRVDSLLGNLLRLGVLLSAGVIVMGAAVYLVRHGADLPQYGAFRGEPSELRSAWGILGDLLPVSGRGAIQFGILLLMATPVMRVLASLVVFLWQRDWIYVPVTLLVLCLLAYSILAT